MSLILATFFEIKTQTVKNPPVNVDSFYRAAHDIRSPLSALNMTVYHFRKMSPHLEHLDLLDETVKRINRIAEDILSARKHQQTELQAFDLQETLNKFSKAAAFQFQDKIAFSNFNTSSMQQLQVQGNKEDFERILANLVQNSYEANACAISFSLQKIGGKLSLKIADNGRGISPEFINKITQKGFTTKDNGNGLGLSSSCALLKSWNGKMEIRSQLDVGTTVEIQLHQV